MKILLYIIIFKNTIFRKFDFCSYLFIILFISIYFGLFIWNSLFRFDLSISDYLSCLFVFVYMKALVVDIMDTYLIGVGRGGCWGGGFVYGFWVSVWDCAYEYLIVFDLCIGFSLLIIG